MYEISELTGNIYFNGVLVPQDDTTPMWQAYWQHKQSGGEIVFVEATDEEIAEANKPKVPCSISRMRLKLELFERNITVEDIVDTITSIPSSVFSEAEKQKALIKFQEKYNIQPSVGYFGPITRKVVNDLLAKRIF